MKVLAEGSSLIRPKGYQGTLYEEVTETHWNYLEALANCGNRPVEWNPDWKKAYKELTGLESHGPPGTMTRGVFEARGWIRRWEGKSGRLQYQITPEGRAAAKSRPLLEEGIQESFDQAEDQRPLSIDEAENLEEAPLPSKGEAELMLQSFRAFAPRRTSVQNVRRYERSEIGRALKTLYDGHCQICNFTFCKRNGMNYAEVHHLEALSEGGWEDPKNLLVVCANCHRQLHYGSLERMGWGKNQLVLKINGVIHRLWFHPSHIASLRA